jgi:protein-tyrosine-phosphatase
MASALLAAALGGREDMSINSAGFVTEGQVPPAPVIELMADLGIDLSGHRSRRVTPDLVAGSDLVVGMTRQHAVDLSLMAGPHWSRCFTYVDLVDRARAVGPRKQRESFRGWLGRINGDRSRSSLLRLPISDDLPDPIGGPMRAFERTRDSLLELTAALSEVLYPV